MTHTKHNIRYNLSNLKLELEYKNKREYTWKQLAKEIGVSERTLSSWLHNRTARIDILGIEKLLDFFADEGMPIRFEKLFSIDYPNTVTDSPDD